MTNTLPKKQQEEFEKPTFRAVNNSYLLLGVVDWRYGLIASMFALVIGAIFHSKKVAFCAWVVLQLAVYWVYSKDPVGPITWVYGMIDKKHLCPFKEK